MSPLLIDAALRASLVLLIGLAARAALRRQPPALRHAVLAIAILVAPIVGPLGRLLPEVAVRTDAWTSAATAGADATAIEATPHAAPGWRPSPPPPAEPRASAAPAWPRVLLAVWTAGTTIGLAVLLLALASLRRLTRAAGRVDDPRWRAALDAARTAAGVSRPVRLLAVPSASLLATCGWRRPAILIPTSALAWSDTRVHAVLAHEMAHVARADWLVQVIADAVRALLWWNPLAWLACRRLRHDGEQACDDAVVRAGVTPAAYADHLLQIARFAHGTPRPAAVVPMARPSTLERRIVVLLDSRRPHHGPSRLAVAGAAAGLLALLLPIAVVRAAQGGRQPLEGVVYDSTGAVVPDARVTLNPGPNKAEARTDAAGHFVFAAVDPGKHELEVAVPGFRALKQPIELRRDTDWTRAITLQIGDLRETVTVSARRPSSPAPAPAAGPTPVRVGGNIRAPRKVKNVNPTYPAQMRDAGLEGVVPIEARIGVDGTVQSVRVASASVHPDLAVAAIDAVRQWKFEPTLLNGHPVEVVMTVTVQFSLE